MVSEGFWVTLNETFSLLGWILLAVSPILIILFFFVYRKILTAYPIEIGIKERRGTNIVWTRDRAGKFFTDGIYKYKLRKSGDTIPILNYDWILHATYTATNLIEKLNNFISGGVQGYAELYKYGSKQYKPIKTITPKGEIKETQEIKDKEGNPVLIEVYKQINPHKRISDIDFEVIDWDNINFMVQEQRATDERRRKKESWWAKSAVPIAAIAIAGLAVIFAFYFSADLVSQAMNQAMGQARESQQPEPAKIPIIGDILTPGK